MIKPGDTISVDLGQIGPSLLTYVRSNCKCSDRHPCKNATRIFKYRNGKQLILKLRDWPELKEAFNIK